ncbi:MAG: POTRA domain-containing protein [Candidatus Acidiferrum sp.]
MPARPQTDATGAKIGAIHVHGMKVFTEKQVIAAIGLKPGQDFDPKQLDAVAERLGKSGAFSDITYSYVPKDGRMAIDFTVEEGKFRHCYFDNFVWLSDAEIEAGLQKQLPLYNGMVPETGEMLENIPGVLEKLSQEKGVTVRVSRMVEQGEVGDPNWSHVFMADGVNVKVQSLRFTGNQAVSEADVRKQAALLMGRNYSAFQSEMFGSKAIVPFYRKLGFLEAKVEEQARILSHAAGSNEYEMEVTFAVTEGDVYRWAGADWSGNRAVTSSALDEATGMKANEIANAEKIELGWEAVQKGYSKSGYLELKLVPEEVLDQQTRLVHYKVRVTEGPQYHMGQIVVTGVKPDAAEKFEKRWKLKPGDIYDGTYLKDFLDNEIFPALRGGGAHAAPVRSRVVPNRERHLVDVTVNLG